MAKILLAVYENGIGMGGSSFGFFLSGGGLYDDCSFGDRGVLLLPDFLEGGVKLFQNSPSFALDLVQHISQIFFRNGAFRFFYLVFVLLKRLTILVVTFIGVTTHLRFSIAVRLVVLPITRVVKAVGPLIGSFAMPFILEPVSKVLGPVCWISLLATAMSLAIEPCSLVTFSVFVCFLTIAVRLLVVE